MSDLTAAVKSIDRLTRTTETIKCCYQGTNNGCKHETVLEKYIPTVNVDPSKIQSLIILSLICTSLSCGTVVVFISLITTSLLVTSLPE